MNLNEAPHPAYLDYGKLLFGIILLVILATLSAIIALGKVEASTSHGLDTLLGGFLTLSGGFANWCFKTGVAKTEKPLPEDNG
jgi:hypothetical protein